MDYRVRLKYLKRLGIDCMVIAIAFVLSNLLLLRYFPQFTQKDVFFCIYGIITWYIATKITFLYKEFLSRSISQELIILFRTVIFHNFLLMLGLFYLSKNPTESKYYLTIFFVIEVMCLSIEKYIMRWYHAGGFYAKTKNATKVLIVGAGNLGLNFYKSVVINKNYQYSLVGFVDDEKKPHLNGEYLGGIDDLDNIFQRQEIEDVVIALPNTAIDRIHHTISISEKNAKRVRIVPDYNKGTQGNYSVKTYGGMPVISVRSLPLDDPEYRFFKRALDIFFSSLLFILVFSWLFPIIAILIKATSKGPIFFIQERWGLNNKKIMCYKFRSMRTDSMDVDESGKYKQACKDDPRITTIGKFLRKTNLDELPQFWNVLKGNMSIIGPRPHPTPLNLESKEIINNYMLRHLVKPGISGWAQVNGFRGETKNPDLMQKRVNLDIWYIENWNFWLDCQIILQTVINMIKGDKNAY